MLNAMNESLIDELHDEIARLRTLNRELVAGIRNIVNGDYDNARTIEAVERYARSLLAAAQERLNSPA